MPLEVKEGRRFVSRGGEKLDGALQDLDFDVSGKTAVDVGAATGGFSDCLLERGVRKIYAVDVGQGLLADKLLRDARVVVMDRTNARHLSADAFEEPIDLVVVDASFIGLDKLSPALFSMLRPGGHRCAMVKPQFEVGREEARRAKGVIKDPEVRASALTKVREDLVARGFLLLSECDSRVAGPKGNVERFMLAVRGPDSEHEHPEIVQGVSPHRGGEATEDENDGEH
jgi:23S rRNA (cytidine1920-2'-O)/16S rRNA (cytidine1409-2'-O)-methyltransferase